jgi:hypothetical protein
LRCILAGVVLAVVDRELRILYEPPPRPPRRLILVPLVR